MKIVTGILLLSLMSCGGDSGGKSDKGNGGGGNRGETTSERLAKNDACRNGEVVTGQEAMNILKDVEQSYELFAGQQFQNINYQKRMTTAGSQYRCLEQSKEIETQTILAVRKGTKDFKGAFAYDYDLEQSDQCEMSSMINNRDVIRFDTFSLQGTISINDELGDSWGQKITRQVYKVDEETRTMCILIDFKGGADIATNLDNVKADGNIVVVLKAGEKMEDLTINAAYSFDISGTTSGMKVKSKTTASTVMKYTGSVNLDTLDLSSYDDMTFGSEP